MSVVSAPKVNSTQIQSATLIFCIAQCFFLLVGVLGYMALAHRIQHYDYGKLHIDEEKILKSIQEATRAFLTDYQQNIESNSVERVPNTELTTLVGSVYWTPRRGTRAIIDGVDYSIGDFIKFGTNLYEVAICDFERQRLYAITPNGDRLILCLRGNDAKINSNDDSAPPPPARRRASDDAQTAGGQIPFS